MLENYSLIQFFLDFLLHIYQNKQIFYTVIFTLLYLIYYKKFRYYKFIQAAHFTKGKHNIGRTIPSYPNGWFRILGSAELSKGEVKYVNLHGENMAVFRGDDGIVYALEAYCAHLGANLAINGTVVNERCIQCPFHAWTFDGKTGNCVIGKEMKPKEAIKYEYVFNSGQEESCEAGNNSLNDDPHHANSNSNKAEAASKAEKDVKCDVNTYHKKLPKSKKAKISISHQEQHELNGIHQEQAGEPGESCSFKARSKEIVKIRKFSVMERSGSIFIWFNASTFLKFAETNENQLETEYPYEPFDISPFFTKLEYRGTSLNTVKSHVQDIAENGGDLLHFLYVHNVLVPFLVKGFWDPKWIAASDPELKLKARVKNNENFNKFRMDLINRYITEKNKEYIGVITLENSIEIAGIPKQFSFFSLTGFQVGPGIVYLFIYSPFFQATLMQYIESRDKNTQYVYHDIYANKYLPYWFSALLLRLEALQVLNDGVVWDNKKFAINAFLNPTNPADNTLLVWRNWYSQFYKDCRRYEEEKRKENLDW